MATREGIGCDENEGVRRSLDLWLAHRGRGGDGGGGGGDGGGCRRW